MNDFPMDRFGLIRRSAVIAAEGSDRRLTAALRRNEIIRMAPGSFLPSDKVTADARGRAEHYRARSIAVATGERRNGDDPLSHDSAAALHGLPTLRPDRSRVHFTSARQAGGRIGRLTHLHSAPLPESAVVEIDGLRVTGLARTACDIAGRSDFAGALTVFDSALRLGVSREELIETLDGHRRRGGFQARRALKHAVAGSASVGESWSRAQIIEAGLPIPEVQVEFTDDRGRMIVDFGWPNGLVGEFDGIDKYVRYLREGESIADAVIREKIREDRLVDLDLRVIRWIWADLVSGAFLRRLAPRLAGLS